MQLESERSGRERSQFPWYPVVVRGSRWRVVCGVIFSNKLDTSLPCPLNFRTSNELSFFFFFYFYLFIYLFIFFIAVFFFFFCSEFCHTLKWNVLEFTCRPVTSPEMMRGRHVHCKFFPKKFFLLTSSSQHFYCLQGGLKVVQPIFNLFIHNSNIGGPALLLEYERTYTYYFVLSFLRLFPKF